MTDSATPITFTAEDPLAVGLTAAIESGALDELSRLLNEHPGLASARIAARRKTWRTPLHVVTHWPGYFPNGPAVVRLLIDAGADPSARSAEGPSETLCIGRPATMTSTWRPRSSMAGPISRLPARRSPAGARSTMRSATAVGTWPAFWSSEARPSVSCGWLPRSAWTRKSKRSSTQAPRPRRVSTRPPWQACHGGQLRTAQLLLARGARIDAVPGYGDGQNPVDIAASLDERRSQLVRWLGEHGAGEPVMTIAEEETDDRA